MELGNYIHKVERKPAEPKAIWYEVMLSPFKTEQEALDNINKYKQYYPSNERLYRITKIKCNQGDVICDDAPCQILDLRHTLQMA